MSNRVADYVALGVENIWILDPVQHEAWTATREGFVPAQSRVLTVPSSPARIDLNKVFTRLDQLFSGRW
jgi:hypothetical protein